MSRPGVAIVIPCLNEARTLPRVLARVRAMRRRAMRGRACQVLVVDNGSADGSAALARRGGARVVACPRRGYGEALRSGFAAARQPLILCMDADDTYDVDQAPALCTCLEQGADLAIGSRQLVAQPAGRVGWLHHRLGTPALTLLANLLHARPGGPRITDVTSGFFGFHRRRLAGLGLDSTGFDLNVELYALALRRGWRVEERPVVQLPSLPERRPHLRTWSDGWLLLGRLLAEARP